MNYIYIYIYIGAAGRGGGAPGRRGPATCEHGWSTVSFYNFKSQNFKLSVSNPKNKWLLICPYYNYN